MRYVHEEGFDLKPGKIRDFERWLETNEEKLRLASPEGVDYLGAYAVVHSTEKDAGDVRIDWGMDAFSAMDRFEVAVGEPGPFRQLLEELYEFADARRFYHTSRILLRSLTSS